MTVQFWGIENPFKMSQRLRCNPPPPPPVPDGRGPCYMSGDTCCGHVVSGLVEYHNAFEKLPRQFVQVDGDLEHNWPVTRFLPGGKKWRVKRKNNTNNTNNTKEK